MSMKKSVANKFIEVCHKTKKEIVFLSSNDEEKHISYQRFYDNVLNTLANLQAKNIHKGDMLIVQVCDEEIYITVFWSCLLGGIIPVLASVNHNAEGIKQLIKVREIIGESHIIMTKDVMDAFGNLNAEDEENRTFQEYICKDGILFEKFKDIEAVPVICESAGEDVAMIQFSSGSTGTPKGVEITYDNLWVNVSDMIKGFQIKEEDVCLSWISLVHDMGLIMIHMTSVLAGIQHIIMSTSRFLENPMAWIQEASHYKATMLSTINFALQLVLECYQESDTENIDLASVRYMLNGAEPISVDLVKKFEETMAKHHFSEMAMKPVYGLAEATVGVTYVPQEDKLQSYNLNRQFLSVGDKVHMVSDDDNQKSTFVEVGVPFEHVSLRICDEENKELEENTIGYLQVKGTSVAKGYYHDEELSNKVFNNEGWLDTGDLGFINNGRLVVTGRAKETIIINGVNYYPSDIERVAELFLNMKNVHVYVTGIKGKKGWREEILVFLYHNGELDDRTDILQELKTKLYQCIGIEIKHVIPVTEVEKTKSGKIQRHKLVEEFLNGSYDKKLQSQSKEGCRNRSTEIEDRLLSIFIDELKDDSISVHDQFFEIGVDSISIGRILRKIHEIYPDKLEKTDFFAYPTISELASYIKYGKQTEQVCKKQIEKTGDIAIVGMAAKFPGADNLDEFWNNLVSKKDCVTEFPEARKKDVESYCLLKGQDGEASTFMKGAYLSSIDQFDYKFFGLTPKEAELMSPSQRIFLEVCYHAIENSGYGGNRLIGSRTGVYLGAIGDLDGYAYKEMIEEYTDVHNAVSLTGNLSCIMPARVSHYLDWKGPAMVVDTACSSSLVAIHLACQALQNGDCNMAVAGGVRVNLLPVLGKTKLGIESTDGKAKAFDESSDGTGMGEGAGVVILKPLEDALRDQDQVYAVIKGSAVNQDGRSASITAPNMLSQVDVIDKAWIKAGVNPESIGYIEAHGTGTKLGDPIEVKAIENAFRKYTNRKQFCAIGTVKSNIGHLYEAAGIAGFIKSVLALKNKKIPATLHFQNPNRNIAFEESPLFVNDQLLDWEAQDTPRRCGISAFGFSGTNAHIILEEAPLTEQDSDVTYEYKLLPISAKTEAGVKQLVKKYRAYVEQENDIQNICYTAQTGRGHYEYRLAISFRTRKELLEKLDLSENLALSQSQPKGLFYEYHKVVNSVEKRNAGYELTESELLELSKQADQLLKEIIKDNASQESQIDALGAFYSKGANIEWDLLYAGHKVSRISLPGYPYEPTRCWLQSPLLSERYIEKWKENYYYQAVYKEQKEKFYITCKPEDYAVVLWKKESLGVGEFLEQLKEHVQVISVELGEQYAKTGIDSFIIGNTADDFLKLFSEIKERHIVQFIHLCTLEPMGMDTQNDIKCKIESGVMSFVRCYQAMCNELVNQPIKITLVSRYGAPVQENEAEVIPANAILYGAGRVIERENKNYQCRAIDLDEDTKLVQVLEDILSDSKNYQTAYRNGIRYVEMLDVLELDEKENAKVTIQMDGAYVITGGLSGIGYEMARYLASEKVGNLVLISRTALPESKTWDDVLENGTDERIKKLIRSVKELESMGTHVECVSADICDYDKLNNAFQKVRDTYQVIHGVIHSAGVMGNGWLSDRNEQEFYKVLAPKVMGTWNLDQVTREDDLDFLVLFSSVSSVLKMPKQADYSAGNAFIDSFAAYRNSRQKKTLVINWPAWLETGMAKDHHFNVNTTFMAIRNEDGVHCLETLLNKKVSRSVVGRINLEHGGNQWIDTFSVALSDEIQAVMNQSPKGRSRFGVKKNAEYQTITASGKQNIGQVEQYLIDICAEVIGIRDIDVEESFFDLGVNSMLLTQLQERIDKTYPGVVSEAQMFSYSSVAKLAKYIAEQTSEKEELVKVESSTDNQEQDIAIIGMSIKMPQCENLEEFWNLIRSGEDAVRSFPEDRRKDIDAYMSYKGISGPDSEYIEAAYLDEIDKFDYQYFHISPKEASLMDPNQRLFLQVAYHAIEDAGYGGNAIKSTRTGVFLGFSEKFNDFYAKYVGELDKESRTMSVPANLSSIIPSRLSYILDLRGPSMLVDTACSSALVSLHLACNALKQNECDMAIAGGVKINFLPVKGKIKLGIESSDCKTKSFDDSSDGTGIGEGVAAVMLKPLKKAIEDHDHIYAVVKASAVNQDGHSAGITAPNAIAQTDVIADAWRQSKVPVESIRYIEAHGTGTILGDPIEIEGLTQAFKQFTDKKAFCNVSSVKNNIGHLYEAAGIAGLVKAVLSLQKGEIAPNAHFEKLNHRINLEDSAVYIGKELESWDDSKYPRRCGVSSFGFSGTNCHVVLEQAQVANVKSDKLEEGWDVLTLSAMNDTVLMRLVKDYHDYLANSQDLDMIDICYTANAGRGHYGSRIALVGNSIDSFREKIAFIMENGLQSYDSQNIYYKKRILIHSSRSVPAEEDLSLAEKRKITESAGQVINACMDKNEWSEKELKELVEYYVNGADVDWEKLYSTKQCNRISVPVYPFEENRCWMEPVNVNTSYHPLLERKVVEVMNETIYATEVKPSKNFLLNEHIVLGKYVLPGTTYMEMLKQVSIRHFGECPIEIKDVLFITPVVLEAEESRTVYAVVKEEECLKVSFFSKAGIDEEQWIQHAEAKICRCDIQKAEKINIQEIKRVCSKEEIEIDFDTITGGFIQYGPRFKNCKKLYMGEKQALAAMELNEQYRSDFETYYIHPSLLDIATASVALTTRERYLPIAYHSFQIRKSIPERFYSLLTERPESGSHGILAYDVMLADVTGEVFAKIAGFRLKQADNFQKENMNEFYHSIVWKKAEAVGEVEVKDDEDILVIRGNHSVAMQICEQLRDKKGRVIEAELGSKFVKKDEANFVVKADEASFNQLLEALKERKIETIINLSGIGYVEEMETVNEVEQHLSASIYGLFYLMKAVSDHKLAYDLNMIVVSDYAYKVSGEEEHFNPFSSAVMGFTRVIGSENENYDIKCIDIDYRTAAEQVVAEILTKNGDKQVSFREGERYVPELEEVMINQDTDRNIEFKSDGVYLITGGTGAIGLQMARHIASAKNANIILLGRTKLPDRESWNTANENFSHKVLRTISTIQEIEQQGSHVMYLDVDVSDSSQMEAGMQKVRAQFGHVDGIIHCAGNAGDGFLFRKQFADFRNVFAPKIFGTWLLSHLTKDMNVDFLITCSSVAAIISEQGQCDYTLANAFMDTFALQRNLAGKRTISIEWTAWDEIGMAFDHKANVDTILKPIKTAQAMEAFDEILKSDATVITVGKLSCRNLKTMAKRPVNLSEALEKKVEAYKVNVSVVPKENAKQEVTVKGKQNGDYNSIELKLSNIWCEVLGYSEINIMESFNDLGGDSILASSLLKEVRKEFGNIIDISDVFSYPTIAEMAKYITETVGADATMEVTSEEEEWNEEKQPEKADTSEFEAGWEEMSDDIAIVGIDGIFPEADNLEEFWQNLKAGKKSIGTFPESRRKDTDKLLKKLCPEAIKYEDPYEIQGYLRDITEFDALFFGISPSEANLMEPEQRLFLQCAWKALEDAGLSADKVYGSKTGVFVGKANVAQTTYKQFIDKFDSSAFTGSINGILASRIAYILNLTGPSMVIDTACSSGVVALHQACMAIKNQECDNAIVGGVSVTLLPVKNEGTRMLESENGQLRPFDSKSNGTVWGEGVGALVIKPLSAAKRDRNKIYAVIKGSGLNNDGASNGITAPSAKAQQELYTDVWSRNHINPETISYIEAHGTGTSLGDPIEVKGITDAMKQFTNRKQFCGIGTVKGNIGHLIGASGIASLMKLILSFEHEEIPATIGFDEPNPLIHFEDSPLYVTDRAMEWKRGHGIRRAAINSFGLSGTNCHVVLEEPDTESRKEEEDMSGKHVFTITAKSKESLKSLVKDYVSYANDSHKNDSETLDDICYTALCGRAHYQYRIALLVSDKNEWREALEELLENDFEQLNDSRIYYGYHRIVSGTKKVLQKGEITSEEKKRLSTQAQEAINERLNEFSQGKTLYDEILRLYIQGADIDWDSLYKGKPGHIIHMPTYSFSKKKCWAVAEEEMPMANEDTIFYQMNWIVKEEENPSETESEKVLVVRGSGEKENQVYEAVRGFYKNITTLDGARVVNSIQENGAEWKNQVEQVFAQNTDEKFTKVIFLGMFAENNEISSKETLELSQELGVVRLFTLLQTLLRQKPEEKVVVDIVSEGIYEVTGDEILYPQNATLQGIGRIISRENMNISCHCIDVDDKTDMECICRELGRNVNEYAIAYRANQRYVEEFAEALPEINEHVSVKPEGVYIVTGGMGGIGLAVAEFLAAAADVHLVLWNRTRMAEREKWDDILQNGENQKMCRAIETVRRLESMSQSSVDTMAVDVSEYNDVKEALDRVRKQYGRIDGIVHCAGIANQILIEEEPEEELRKVLASKVKGTWNLGELTNQDELDFMMLFSSISTKFGMAGQADYSAANSFMDAYAQKKGREGRNILAIDWVAWREVGMAADQGFTRDTIFKAITTDKAMEAFKELLCVKSKQVMVGELNYESKMINLLTKSSFLVANTIKERLKEMDNRDKNVSERWIEKPLIHPMVERLELESFNQDVYVTDYAPDKHWILSEHRVADNYAIAGMAYPEAARAVARRYFGDNAIELKEFLYITPVMLYNGEEEKQVQFVVTKNNEQELGFVVCSKREDSENSLWQQHVQGKICRYKEAKAEVQSISEIRSRCNKGVKIIVFNDVLKGFFKFGERWITSADLLLGENEVLFEVNLPDKFVKDLEVYHLHPAIMDIAINAMGYLLEDMYLPISFDSFVIYGVFQQKTVSHIRKTSPNVENPETVTYDIELMDENGCVIVEVKNFSLKRVHSVESLLANNKPRTVKKKTISETVKLIGREDNLYSDLERTVASIWGEVLGFQEVDIYDDFYSMGGDSIFAVKLVNELNQKLGINLTVVDLFKCLSVYELAQSIGKNANSKEEFSAIQKVEEREYYDASLAQASLLILDSLEDEESKNIGYNMPEVLLVEGKLDLDALREALHTLAMRHESIRTCFDFIDGVPVQKILHDVELKLEIYEAGESEVNNIIRQFIRPFDLRKAPLFRTGLIKIEDERYIFMLDMHHIVSDGWSEMIFIRELISLLSGEELATLELQYKDYAAWHNNLVASPAIQKQLDYWLKKFEDEVSILNMPTDFPRPKQKKYDGDRIVIKVDIGIRDKLNELAMKTETTLYMVLLAAYNIVLSKYSGQEDLIIGSPYAGRNHKDVQNIIGMFVNMLAMRNKPIHTMTYHEFLLDLKKNALEVYENEDIPFNQIVSQVKFERDITRNPLFDYVFALHNFDLPELITEDLKFSLYDFDYRISRFDMYLFVVDIDGEFRVELEYSSNLFKKTTAERFVKHYVEVLEQIIDNTDIKLQDIVLSSELSELNTDLLKDEEGDFDF